LSIWIELNEADHLRRRVPCRIFTSNGTAPDTGAQGDAVIMAINSFTTISLSSALTAVHASNGMYMEQLTQSNCSVLGTHMLYHIAGDFPQHIATIQVVNSNPFSTQSNLLVNSIAANSYSGVTIQGLSNYANISNVTLHAGTHSNVTIQGVTRVNSNVTLNAGLHSGATIDGLSNKTYFQDSVQSSVWSGKRSDWTTPGSFGEYVYSQATGTSTGTIKGVANYANISNVTLHAGTHSNVTIQGLSNYGNLPFTSIATSIWSTLRSNFTTPGSFGEYTYSQVTGTSTGTVKGVQNYANISNVTLHAGTHSDVTIQGVSNTANFPSGSGATAGEVAREVWANSGRTLDGVSTATIFVHPRSVWSTLRSDYTTPGSFGEYVYSQVTGTSSGTVQGVTRALNLSANGDKTGYTLSAAGLADFFDTDSGTNYAGSVAGSVVKEIADNAGGSSLTEGGIARAVWANSGRTLEGTSIATIFAHPRSVWSTLRSDFTTPGSFGEFVWSKVTGISTGTVFGITDTSNFPSGSGATAGETARAVWANSGRTLDGVSIATIFTDSRSIWSALRSAYTTPGSFGEFVYSQVTGTSSGTVQGVTRALNLSTNGDKTGYSISGTKTTLDALNDIDGSGVTLHAGTHSGATVQGLSNYANISNVTLHAGVHSAATVQGVNNYANISNVTLHAGTHSGVTIQGVTRINSGVTLNADTHSGATIAGIVDGGIIASTLASGVITSAKFASGAIDAVALASDAGQEIADRVLLRNIASGSDGGRDVRSAIYPLRNRSLIQGSVGTVYEVDDSTSAWTFSPSLGTAPLSGIDPLGP
jgi:hypothetical protein